MSVSISALNARCLTDLDSPLHGAQAALLRAAAAGAEAGGYAAAAAAAVAGSGLAAPMSAQPSSKRQPPAPQQQQLQTSLPMWICYDGVTEAEARQLAALCPMPAFGISLSPAGPAPSAQEEQQQQQSLTLESLAAQYAQGVVLVQPAGPFLLLGLGPVGCGLAFEAARVLEQQMSRPVMLLLLDGGPGLPLASEGLALMMAAGAAGGPPVTRYDPMPSIMFGAAHAALSSAPAPCPASAREPLPSSFAVFTSRLQLHAATSGSAPSSEAELRSVLQFMEQYDILAAGEWERQMREAFDRAVLMRQVLEATSEEAAGLKTFGGPTALLLPEDSESGLRSSSRPGSQAPAHPAPPVVTLAMGGLTAAPPPTRFVFSVPSAAALEAARRRCSSPVTHLALEASHGACLLTPEARVAAAASIHEAVWELMQM